MGRKPKKQSKPVVVGPRSGVYKLALLDSRGLKINDDVVRVHDLDKVTIAVLPRPPQFVDSSQFVPKLVEMREVLQAFEPDKDWVITDTQVAFLKISR